MLEKIIPISPVYLFTFSYLTVSVIYALMNWTEFKKSPEKGNRYRALPIGYKLACRLIVLPMIAGMVIQPDLGMAALIPFAIVEAACVRWYKKNGLL